jgi:hypothetical protein
MKIEIIRDHLFPSFTVGTVYVDGVKICRSIEDCVRERQGEPVSDWKIPGETAIPSGDYKVTITPSTRFKRDLPLINGVDGFSGVRIHTGNTSEDTEGCIIVGMTWDGDDFVGGSRVAFQQVFKMISDAIRGGDTVTLSIA